MRARGSRLCTTKKSALTAVIESELDRSATIARARVTAADPRRAREGDAFSAGGP
jgi:hypothetical protein